MTELIWDGKYDKDGKKVSPVKIALPFQTIETVNESAADREKRLTSLFDNKEDTTWYNRLIWGDKKYVLPSLLPEFAGKVNLIYIDPPFDTGADFSFKATIADNPNTKYDETTEFLKEPNIIEQKAYRDTWGKGLDSYLQWFYETAMLLRDLLADNGSLYIHLDWHVVHYTKPILDEIFGYENFRDNIVWCYKTRQFSKKYWNRKHDDILFYTKSKFDWIFNWEDVKSPLSESTIKKYKLVDDQGGRYRLNGRGITGSPIRSAKDVDAKWEKTNPELVVRDYLRDGYPPEDWWNIDIINQVAIERVDYATQKPEALLERIIKASSNIGDIVLDCFAGSGTTSAVAEKLGRRWITADLGRFAIHTTRKRLLGIPDVKPFVVQNLGKYERQQWMKAEFKNGETRSTQEKDYRNFIVGLYDGEPLSGHMWLHGVKGGRMIHVGSVDSPVADGDVKAIVQEFWKVVGKESKLKTNGIDILGWDFAFEINRLTKDFEKTSNVNVSFKKIPREVLEKRAVEQGDIHFFELGSVDVDVITSKMTATVSLKDFMIPLDDVPEEARKAITHWSQFIDYWAIDWDYKDDTFHNVWQSYRTKKDMKLELKASHEYEEKGVYEVVIKVIDILGNDSTKAVKIKI